jgi:ribosomal protein S18 acetylase RimI-like enzyme
MALAPRAAEVAPGEPGKKTTGPLGHPVPAGRKLVTPTELGNGKSKRLLTIKKEEPHVVDNKPKRPRLVPIPSEASQAARAVAEAAMREFTACGLDASRAAEVGASFPASAPSASPADSEVFARMEHKGSRYYIARPQLSDVYRLRQIEREFVHDHWQIFSDEPWAAKLGVADWCSAVNVIVDEVHAVTAISSIVRERTNEQLGRHITLHCVHVPPKLKQRARPEVIGYVHFVEADAGNYLDVSHLKVVAEHKGRGVGSLLLEGMARHASRLGHNAGDMRLVVMSKNVSGIKLYEHLGFMDLGQMKKDIGFCNSIAWTRMRRYVAAPPGEIIEDFCRRCREVQKERGCKMLAE